MSFWLSQRYELTGLAHRFNRLRSATQQVMVIAATGSWALAAIFFLFAPSLFAIDFEKNIEPILKSRCLECHGSEKQKGQFRVDRLASLLQGGDSGEAAVVPGNPKNSFLIKAIRHEEPDYEMPPRGEKLTDAEIALIEDWIREDAETPERLGPAEERVELIHWSFTPLKKSDQANSIDGFVGVKLAENGLTLSERADRRALIRRLYLVMLGLPPTPEQVERFMDGESDEAWNALVEDVLASPHYGERWATHWLDLVRFGESNGFETNRERLTAWPFRDWVIDSFNQDKPYDQFVREQIAGDSVGSPIGTGFLVAGPFDTVKGQDPKLGLIQRMNELDDMINTTGTAFLGLTTGCARCHNHKFDPVSQVDYYAMQAVFAGVKHGEAKMPLTKTAHQKLTKIRSEIADLKTKMEPFISVSTGAAVAIDDAAAILLEEKRGHGVKLGGPEPNLSGGSYTWWTRTESKDVIVYQPRVSGSYRIWLSWGAGHESHSTDTRYILQSVSGEKEIAKVNQQQLADGSGKVNGKSLWSGLFDAGVHELKADDKLVVRGGKTGTAMTADIVFFQPASSEGMPSLRAAVNAKHNLESFAPTPARFVRFSIAKTNRGQPCLDELEIFSGDKNVALTSNGAVATSSGDFVHPKHKLEHINDGQYGNSKSWISENTEGWVQIEFPDTMTISRIEWARDREGKFDDRVAIDYQIEAAVEPGKWMTLASSADRMPVGEKQSPPELYRFTGENAAQGLQWHAQLKQLEAEAEKIDKSQMVYAGKFAQPGTTHRLYRGEPDAKREEVGPDAIAVFASLGLEANAPEKERRVALADWIASPDNPLTARVIVNRLWQFHFGTGIVDTPSDFGRNGSAPTHPELLDWLAMELIENGWSLKHMHRLILQSATWQQSNRPNSAAMKVDATSRLLWRFPPRRLEAEGIRDSILAVTGSLDLNNRGGPGFSPFEVEMENVRHYHPKKKFGPDDWRRMIYMTKIRQEREQVFGAFDCPDASQAVPKRSRSTTPLQALNLLNSQFVIQQADLFADLLELESDDREAQIRTAYERCFNRPATDMEISDANSFIEAEGLNQFTRAMLNTNEFVFIP